MGNGGGGDGNQNYANASASAQAPVGNRQAVSVSCSVLAPSQGVEAWLVQTQESGEAESVLVLQLNLQGGTGNQPTWIPVAFNGNVELEEGNAITQVEILSDMLGNLTIQVAPGQSGANAAAGATPPAPGACPPGAAPPGGSGSGSSARTGTGTGTSSGAGAGAGSGNPNFPFVKFMTHSAPGDLQMQVVYGEVKVPNPGVLPVLRQVSPPGIAPNVLALQLELVQRPGQWPQQEYLAWFHYGVTATIMRYQRPANELLILGGALGNVTVAAQDV